MSSKCDCEYFKIFQILNKLLAGRSYTTNMATPTKNESTINLSDFERTNPKISNASEKVIIKFQVKKKIPQINKILLHSKQINFETNEISARSSSLGNNSKTNNLKIVDTIDLSCPSPVRGLSSDFSAKYKSIYDRIRQSDISIAELCDRNSKLGIHTEPLGQLSLPDIDTIDISTDSSCSNWSAGMQDSLYNKLQNELFTPGELAMDKLMKDEASWRRTNDDMPVTSNNKEHLNLSCFSGFIGDGDISVKYDIHKLIIRKNIKNIWK